MQTEFLRQDQVAENVTSLSAYRIAVLIPCYNEEVTIAGVVRDMRAALPDSAIYVYDNNSTDRTMAFARDAGAITRRERLQGKGHVIRRMFADIEADFYVLIDGDGTYEAAAAPKMVRMALENGHDTVMGVRNHEEAAAYRPGHVLGNKVLTGLVVSLFGRGQSDMLSGYRVFSRRFVKSFPALSSGFETETEFTVHTLELNMSMGEVQTRYSERPEGSFSKLNTYKDGFRILGTIVNLLKQERPFLFFGSIGVVLALLGGLVGLRSVLDFIETHTVPHLPSAVLATGLELLAALSLVCGLILNSVALGRQESKRLAYLALSAPPRIDL
ncbi:glycosyltransferase [Asaia lannensis]|uniref:Glycosyltransferase n=1 Tax=Asaia lannensis NBRC 102526 TaxID=1307926 RepID=A0ABT1CDU6_9PROT|nr:glycosyltransferase [Asaia lannensis]MCO6159023.1 glycosyltransferase [Asaia lannensis NBRC 102526]GBQ96636.1 glycosyltransferase [Asaia lannensis NBRC 102526]